MSTSSPTIPSSSSTISSESTASTASSGSPVVTDASGSTVVPASLISTNPATSTSTVKVPPKIKPFNYREFFGAFQTLFFSFVLVALIYRVFVSLAKII